MRPTHVVTRESVGDQHMRNRFRTTFATAAAAALVVGSAGLAVADSVSVTPADETKAPGEGGYFLVYLVAGSEDGDLNNCNVNGGNPGQISFESDAPDVVASPGSVALVFCDDPTTTALEGAVAVSYEVAADAPDGATATITATAAGGRSTGNPKVYGTYSPDSFTLTVQAPAAENTPPQVSVTGFTDGDAFEIGSEPTPGCSVVDAEDGEQAVDPQVDRSDVDEHGLGTVTVTCSYTDTGGETGTATASYTVEDTVAPTIVATVDPESPDGANGWYVTAPTVSFVCDDTGSGVQSCSPDVTLDESATPQSVSGTAVDWAGNAASATVDDLLVDLSDPTDVTFVGGIADGSSFPWGDVPDVPTCEAADAISGLAGCVVSGYSTEVGDHTLTATATDDAGRTATATLTYAVDPWRHDGFYRPVDMGKVNTVKAGSTVPLKFNVFKGDASVTDVAVLGATFSAKQVDCATEAPTDAVEEFATTGGTTLRYDAEAQQWIQNWATPKAGKGSCYLVTVTTADGTATSARFQLK